LVGNDDERARVNGFHPLVSDPHWRALKDAVYQLIMQRASQLPNLTFGDAADRRLVQRLAALRPDAGAKQWTLGGVFDIGYDLGRHVYSKRILHDHLGHALGILAVEAEQSGLGIIEQLDVFHRRAVVQYGPPEGVLPEGLETIAFFVGGLILGSLEDVFNSRVEIVMLDGSRFEIAIGGGRDVNKEAEARA
jgi:hypothetical protein